MDWKSALKKELQHCLKSFPEIKEKEIAIIVESSSELAGTYGRRLDNQPVIILSIPPVLQNQPLILRAFIYFLLSHLIDSKNPEKVFLARKEDKKWLSLQEFGGLKNIVEKSSIREVKGNA